MSQAVDTWYVLADGTHAVPGDVSSGEDGVLRHKNGVPVALRENGMPMTSGVATKTNKLAAEAGKEAGGTATGDGSMSDMTVAQLKELAAERGVDLGDATKKADIVAALNAASAAKDREMKAGGDDKTYQTR